MKRFSERQGFKPVRETMQIESIDGELRNGLWNALSVFYWEEAETHGEDIANNDDIRILLRKIWFNYFKVPLDTLSRFWSENYSELRKYFFSCQWFEVYDFLEFVARECPDRLHPGRNTEFTKFCNNLLERESSGYRFVQGEVTPITDSVEITEIDQAFSISGRLKPVRDHLQRSLELLSDRQSPDYRNSIKESISAVEGICSLIAGRPKADLGEAIGKVRNKFAMHPALEKAFKILYGYTSDENGIRHALMEESNAKFEDAKFMLVACSAFVNYLLTKTKLDS